MVSSTLEKVRSEALNPPEADRAELAYNLVISLDGPPDTNVEQAWDAEIESGTATLIDREEFRRRLRARIRHSGRA